MSSVIIGNVAKNIQNVKVMNGGSWSNVLSCKIYQDSSWVNVTSCIPSGLVVNDFVSFYEMNSTSSANDYTSSNNGSITQTVDFSTDIGVFDGDSGYISLPRIFPSGTLTDYSYSTWVKPYNVSSNMAIFANWDNVVNYNNYYGYGVRFISNQIQVFHTDGGTFGTSNYFYSSHTAVANELIHLVITFSNGLANLYINGSIVDSNKALPSPEMYTTDTHYIGAQEIDTAGTMGFFIDGEIGCTRIYNRELTSTEADEIYQSERLIYGV